MRVNVGDLVLLEYTNFMGENVNGLFAVIYHESMDNISSSNFNAIKVSTNEYLYQVKLETEYLPFLHHDSYLNCNQVFRFRENQVINILGRLTTYYLNKTLQQINNYNKQVEDGIVRMIGVDRVFENII